jgi:type I restriction enzyme M protein
VDESVLSEGEQEIAVAVRLLDEFPLAADRAGSALTTAVFSSLVDQIVDAEGRRAVDHVTSASVAALVVGLAGQVSSGSRIHDPYCRTGELLASVVARAAETYPASDLVVTGSHESVRMLRLARMRLALLGVPGVSSSGSLHQLGGAAVDRGSVDVVVTNPPFSSRAPWPETEPDWPFGPPPRTNANFAWIQHAVSLLREGGRAVVVMANNASFSASPRERRIRENMIESGAVSCLVALPPGLFRGTGVLTTLWVLRPPTGRGDSILFLDARKFGAMVSPAHRILTNRDIDTIVSTFLDWRRASDEGRQQTAVAGLSTVATVDEIRDRDYALSPPMYVETPTGSNAGGPSIDDVPAFAVELSGLRLRAAEIDRKVEQLVWRLGPWRL